MNTDFIKKHVVSGLDPISKHFDDIDLKTVDEQQGGPFLFNQESLSYTNQHLSSSVFLQHVLDNTLNKKITADDLVLGVAVEFYKSLKFLLQCKELDICHDNIVRVLKLLLERYTNEVSTGIKDDDSYIKMFKTSLEFIFNHKKDILYLVSKGPYLYVHWADPTGSTKKECLRIQMKLVEDYFMGDYIRIHQSYIVNRKFMSRIVRRTESIDSNLIVKDLNSLEHHLPISRNLLKKVRSVMDAENRLAEVD